MKWVKWRWLNVNLWTHSPRLLPGLRNGHLQTVALSVHQLQRVQRVKLNAEPFTVTHSQHVVGEYHFRQLRQLQLTFKSVLKKKDGKKNFFKEDLNYER